MLVYAIYPECQLPGSVDSEHVYPLQLQLCVPVCTCQLKIPSLHPSIPWQTLSHLNIQIIKIIIFSIQFLL